jgi:SAM-dependent methyltransferase
MVMNAYHSAHMKEVANEYLYLLGNLAPPSKSPPSRVEMFSSVTGARVEKSSLDAAYWVENLIRPVRFMDALTSMCFSRIQKGQVSLRLNASASDVFTDVLIEIGPHAALQSVIKETLATKVDNSVVMSLAVLSRSTPGLTTILGTVATLSSTGYPIDLHLVNESSKIAEATTLKSGRPKMLVNLPPYSFNHSEGLLYESRLSKNYRLRKYPRHDLFGAPVADWNVETPRWRHILRLSEQPWIRDHVVTGAVVYPGVGYLIAAIEASRQIADQKMEISGFRLRDVSLKRALIIPDTKEGVEVSLSLTRMDESSLWGSSVWKKFQIHSYNPVGDDWIEHCTGYIAVDYETAVGPIDNGREADAEATMWKETLEAVRSRCVALLDIESIYENLVTTGLTFGPLFKNLSNVRGTAERAGEVFGTVTVPNIAEAMPAKYAHEHLIHPATMDSMMHFFLASAMDRSGKRTLERPMVPTFIKDVWVSAKVSSEPTHQFRCYGKCKYLAYDKYEADVMVWDAPSSDARISIKGIRSTPLESADGESGPMRKLCHEIEWTPYLELLTSASFRTVELMSEEEDLDYKGWINKLQLASLLMVTDALDELQGVPPAGLDGHFLKYFNWMNQLREWLDNDNVSGLRRSEWEQYNQDAVLKAELFEQVIGHNADGQLAVRMGSNIVKVLRKEVDPLDLMFGQDDILDRVYEQVVKLGDLPALQRAYLSIVKMNCTNLNILEIGGGTGSSTSAMLESLSPIPGDGSDATSSIGKYTFTDISSAFFEKAREKFRPHGDIMEFKILDAEKDVVKQGFESATYDLIVAGNVVHATADLRRTLGNLRKLLKPGGRLILHEGVRQDFFWSAISFGQLPGWWLGTEPIRRWSPWITIPEWNTVLRDAGFSGIDLNLGDRQNPDLHTQSLMVATAVGTSVNNVRPWDETIIVTTSPISEGFSDIVRTLNTHLEHELRVPNCRVVHYLDLASTELDRAVCISVMDLERPVLQTLSEEEFHNIRRMLSICKGLLWVMPDIISHPECAMVVGLLRTVRWERDLDEANLATLSISDSSLSPARLSQAIGTLYKQQFDGTLPPEKINGEYMLKDGVFLTSRLVNGKGADEYLASKSSRPRPVLQALQDAGRPIKLATAAPGLLDKLEWVTDPVYDEPLDDTQVEIDIKAVALNFRDLMIAMGEHMAYSMGNEAAGKAESPRSPPNHFVS